MILWLLYSCNKSYSRFEILVEKVTDVRDARFLYFSKIYRSECPGAAMILPACSNLGFILGLFVLVFLSQAPFFYFQFPVREIWCESGHYRSSKSYFIRKETPSFVFNW